MWAIKLPGKDLYLRTDKDNYIVCKKSEKRAGKLGEYDSKAFYRTFENFLSAYLEEYLISQDLTEFREIHEHIEKAKNEIIEAFNEIGLENQNIGQSPEKQI